MAILPTHGAGLVRPAGGQLQRRGLGPAFQITADPPLEAASASAVPAASLDALLLLQEASFGPDQERNRRARGQARMVLDLLRTLQHGLLLGDVAPEQMARLARLAHHLPDAADPALRETVLAVAVRAEVELARLEMARHVPVRHRPV